MKILYKTGPKSLLPYPLNTGHAERSQATQLQIDLGNIEEVLPEPPAPPKVTWAVTKGAITERIFLQGSCSRPQCSLFRFEGRAADAHRHKFLHSCGADALPDAIPTEVINRYAAAKNEEVPRIGDDEANYYGIINHVGDSGKRAPLHQGYGADGKPILKEAWWK